MIANLRFAGDLHPFLVIGFALAAAGLVCWLYLRESRTVAPPYSYILPGLRGSAIALAILVLAGPVWHRRQTIGTLGRVVFAVDTSASMAMTDSGETGSSPTRLDRALRWLSGDVEKQGWIETLRDTHEIEVIAFSAGDPTLVWSSKLEEELPSAFELSAEGRRTDLAIGMSSTLATLTPTHRDHDPDLDPQRAALVLMTDGRDNEGASPDDVADQLFAAGVRVHAIGMGSEDEPAEIGIVDVNRPDNVASDGRLGGEVVLNQFGLDGRQVRVRIESGGEIVWQQTIEPDSPGLHTIPFELDVESIVERISGKSPRGVRRSSVVMDLRAVIEPVEGDTTSTNNAMPFRVAASTRDRRLLVLDGSSRWETRYVRNLFQRDPTWTVDSVLFGEGTDMAMVKRGDQPGQLPNSREAMARYDAIILGEIPPDQVTDSDAALLREFVTRGGGLIVIDGRYQRLQELVNRYWPDLIPVSYLDEFPMPVQAVRPSRMGLDHPVLNLWSERKELAEFWENLPAPRHAPRVRAKQGAEVWADVVGVDGRESPWLITRLFGAGRVFYLSTDHTWRWRYKVADRFHARFWNQLVAAVMQPPYSVSDDYVALGTDKIEYESGESATVRVRLQDTGGQPVGDATVDALLVADDRVVATVPLNIDDPARGTYRGETPPLELGAYEVRIRASGFDANALQASTPIWVGSRDTVELRRVSLDKNGLGQITETGGGAYYHESSAEQILESLRPLSAGTIVESDILVWQSFYWFWAVLLLLSLEWWLRKRAGLV